MPLPSDFEAAFSKGAHGAGGEAEVNDVPATFPGAQTPGEQCPTHALSLGQAL